MSDELYDQYLDMVYSEVENINEDLAQNMINDEFVMESHHYKDNEISQFSTESYDWTVIFFIQLFLIFFVYFTITIKCVDSLFWLNI